MFTFKLYFESTNPDLSLNDILTKARSKGIDVFVYLKNKKADLVHIQVPKNTSGLGSWFMQNLTKWADMHDITIKLSPAQKGDLKSKIFKTPSSKNRLIQFYKRFDFVLNKGKYKRFDISDTMYRTPKQSYK